MSRKKSAADMMQREDEPAQDEGVKTRRKRSSSALFSLSGMSTDIVRKWARLPPFRLNGKVFPRVRCLSLDRSYVTEEFVEELFKWSSEEGETLSEGLRDVWRFPEMVSISGASRDAQRLRALGLIPEGSDEVSLLTMRGTALAFRAMEKSDRRAWQKANTTGTLRRIAAITRFVASEPKPTEESSDEDYDDDDDSPESRRRRRRRASRGGRAGNVAARSNVPVDVEGLPQEEDPEEAVSVLKRRRTMVARMLLRELSTLRREVATLRTTTASAQSDLDHMKSLVAASSMPVAPLPVPVAAPAPASQEKAPTAQEKPVEAAVSASADPQTPVEPVSPAKDPAPAPDATVAPVPAAVPAPEPSATLVDAESASSTTATAPAVADAVTASAPAEAMEVDSAAHPPAASVEPNAAVTAPASDTSAVAMEVTPAAAPVAPFPEAAEPTTTVSAPAEATAPAPAHTAPQETLAPAQ